MARSGSQAHVSFESVLEQVRKGKVAPLYVLYGASYLTEEAARSLVEVLVEPSQKSWNLEIYDGRTTPVETLVQTLRMAGFGSGTKVVWLRETTLFLSRDSRAEIVAAMAEHWMAKRERQAAEKLLSLAALAGWSAQQWETMDWTRLVERQEHELFGATLDDEMRAALPAIASAARQLNLRPVPAGDDAEELLGCLEAGLAPRVVLIITASSADRRRRTWQRLAELGVVVEFELERERSQALAATAVASVAQQVARRHGKEIDAAGLQLLVARAGVDPQRLAAEVEKLCLWAGEKKRIGRPEVEAVVADLAEAWVFDFTAAFAERATGRALVLLRQLFDRGEVPLRLLALIARELRFLLLAREALDLELGGRLRARDFASFKAQILPRLDPATAKAFGESHPFVLYRYFQNCQRWSREELEEQLIALSALDAELKASRSDPGVLLEHFVSVCMRERKERGNRPTERSLA